MKEQEAIKKINMMDEALNFQRHDADECSQALQMAIEALEKQTPQKPIIKTNLMTKHVSAHCSICDTDITYYSSEEKYCHKCGRAIKWE